MKRIFIAGNPEKPGCREAVRRITDHLKNRAVIAGTDLSRAVSLPKGHIDLAISLGGDGTFMNLAHQVAERDLPIMGINFGRLGFLTTGMAADLEALLDAYLEGRTEEISRMLLEVEVPGGSPRSLALNDVVVCSSDLTRVFTLRALTSLGLLFEMRGDGLIIATPTGSTAHSLAMGGALVDPRLEALQLTPMGAQSMSSRPIVVHPEELIEVEISYGTPGAYVLADGRRLALLKERQRVRVCRSVKKFRMVQLKDFQFFHRLREKLGWNLNPMAREG